MRGDDEQQLEDYCRGKRLVRSGYKDCGTISAHPELVAPVVTQDDATELLT